MNSEAADLVDRLDLSMSSIDMTNTSLAMHEERESEISGIGELTAPFRDKSLHIDPVL